jgi:dimethylargininase
VKASRQHSQYEKTLALAGLEVVRFPDLPDAPDAVFVEDTAILLGAHAIITRPGAPSRAGETESTAAALQREFTLHPIERGHLDGGDVMRIGRRLYVGVSSRTDRNGIEELRRLVRPLGFEVAEARVRDCLHLKTAATFAGPDAAGNPVLLYYEHSIDAEQFDGVDPVAVATSEAAAANCLRAGEQVILALGNPRTADTLRNRGMNVVEVDVSELQKAEAGVTCMSLVEEPV